MKNIFVGNLSFGSTEDDVRSMFEAYGTVDRVSIVTDRDTGRALNINEARPKEDRGGSGGFRGNGGGGGGGGGQRQNRRW